MAAVLVAAVGLACTPIVEKASFSLRPDSLRSGDLLGPFEGVVLDAETERPVAGATVAGSWAFERGLGLVGPAGAREQVVETGPDGRYRIPALRDLPSGASTRVRRFTLIVYRRGYVGWRSDWQFPALQPRQDFAQRGNRIRLSKWQPDYRHHKHVAFLGGGEAIRTAAAWELQPASLELEGTGPRAAQPRAAEDKVAALATLAVAPLLSEQEVRGVTGYPGAFDVGKLTDLPATEFYGSRHFKAAGRPESYDVALRVWAPGPAGAEEQYRKLLAELPGAVSTDEIGDASLRARADEVTGLAFLRREPGIVVSLTCGIAQCTEPSMVLKLGKLVESHLGNLKLPASAMPSAPPPEAP